MRHAVRIFRPVLVGLVLGFALVGSGALAEDVVEIPIKQIKLTEGQVTSFVSAQSDLAKVSSKLQDANAEPDDKTKAELEDIAKKHGFASFSELDDVAANITLVMAGLDSQTGEFTDPAEALAKELNEVKADVSIADADKKQLVDELTEAIKATPKLEHKENVDVVKAHRAEIEKALQ